MLIRSNAYVVRCTLKYFRTFVLSYESTFVRCSCTRTTIFLLSDLHTTIDAIDLTRSIPPDRSHSPPARGQDRKPKTRELLSHLAPASSRASLASTRAIRAACGRLAASRSGVAGAGENRASRGTAVVRSRARRRRRRGNPRPPRGGERGGFLRARARSRRDGAVAVRGDPR